MEIFQTSETSFTSGYVCALTSRPSGWWKPSQPCGPAGWWCLVSSGILLHSESSSHPVSPGTARGGSDQRGGTCCSTPSVGCSRSPLWQHFMKTKHKTGNKQEVNQCLTLTATLFFKSWSSQVLTCHLHMPLSDTVFGGTLANKTSNSSKRLPCMSWINSCSLSSAGKRSVVDSSL